MKKAVKAAFIYVAVLLGAGFASGREVYEFFGRFGAAGFVGIAIASTVIGFIGAAVLEMCAERRLDGYNAFIKDVLGGAGGKITGLVANIFVLVMFSVMLAGTGAMAENLFGVPSVCGIIAAAVLCFAALMFNTEGILSINAYLAPILIFGGVFVGLKSISAGGLNIAGNGRFFGEFAVSGVVYASYNIITAIAVLSCMRGTVGDKKTARSAGALTAVFMFVLCSAFALPLMGNPEAARFEIPMLSLVGGYTRVIYVAVLAAAIFTTAVSNAFSAREWFRASFKLDARVAGLAVCVIGAVAANAGFSTLVANAYRFFGYLGLFEIAAITLKYVGWRLPQGQKNKESIYES